MTKDYDEVMYETSRGYWLACALEKHGIRVSLNKAVSIYSEFIDKVDAQNQKEEFEYWEQFYD